jgi:PD-(D/E)XK nuclease superfamily
MPTPTTPLPITPTPASTYNRALRNTRQGPPCPECHCPNTIRKGKRRNRMRSLQVYQCCECLHRFTLGDASKHKSYPLKAILDTISTFNSGHSLSETQAIIRRRFHLNIPERTMSSWIAEHRALATYARLRSNAKANFDPKELVRSYTLEHRQVYVFRAHQAKLDILNDPAQIPSFVGLKAYFDTFGPAFPHHLFTDTVHRSSKFPTELHPTVTRKENNATRLAALALPTSPNNRKRHETLQRFMLLNDSVTVAVEIPVYLTKEDLAYYRSRGFDLAFDAEVITGHIDFLQIRNGFLHILDYKPDARKEKHAHVQLTIYALALARRTGLPVKFFKCAWFDKKDYFEFFPLTAVHQVQ